jgi:hypothetical protein
MARPEYVAVGGPGPLVGQAAITGDGPHQGSRAVPSSLSFRHVKIFDRTARRLRLDRQRAEHTKSDPDFSLVTVGSHCVGGATFISDCAILVSGRLS